MNGVELAAAIAFERRWDDRMGGLVTRTDREYLGYTVGRLLEFGVAREQLLEYFGELLDYDDTRGIPT